MPCLFARLLGFYHSLAFLHAPPHAIGQGSCPSCTASDGCCGDLVVTERATFADPAPQVIHSPQEERSSLLLLLVGCSACISLSQPGTAPASSCAATRDTAQAPTLAHIVSAMAAAWHPPQLRSTGGAGHHIRREQVTACWHATRAWAAARRLVSPAVLTVRSAVQ